MRSNDLLNQGRLSANYPERTSPLDGREFSRQPGAIIVQTCFRRQSPLSRDSATPKPHRSRP